VIKRPARKRRNLRNVELTPSQLLGGKLKELSLTFSNDATHHQASRNFGVRNYDLEIRCLLNFVYPEVASGVPSRRLR
jgi:hypothetical protein